MRLPLSWRDSPTSKPKSAGDGIELDPAVQHNDEAEPPGQKKQREVVRKLKNYHVFFISVSGILGVGLYVQSANMLRLGGPAAVIIPFAILGVLAWMIMQCISEMLLIWPVSGALRLYVEKFVDKELGMAVGIAYWFSNAMAFAALTAATGGEANVWGPISGYPKSLYFYLMCPILLLVLNSFGVEYYGHLEVAGGIMKLSFIFVVVWVMFVINLGAGTCEYLGTQTWSHFVTHDETQVDGWAQAFFVALQIAAFSFNGIEIPAVLAVEADIFSSPETPLQAEQVSSLGTRFKKRLQRFRPDKKGPANRVLKFSAVYLPAFMSVIYLLAGFLITLNVSADDPSLPRSTFDGGQMCDARHPSIGSTLCGNVTCTASNSGFVISVHNAHIPGLESTMTVFLILTALSTANTVLYLASRTLYDIARSVRRSDRYIVADAWWKPSHLFALFAEVPWGVPIYALIASTFAFFWLPLLSFDHSDKIAKLLYIMTQMAAECTLIVWACECLAFIRFHKFITLPENRIWIANKATQDPSMAYLLRDEESYPYRSYAQPLLAWIAFIACVLILAAPCGALLWNGPSGIATYSIAAYLAPLCFLVLWFVLKVIARLHGDPWIQKSRAQFQTTVEELNEERDAGRGRTIR